MDEFISEGKLSPLWVEEMTRVRSLWDIIRDIKFYQEEIKDFTSSSG